MWECRNWGLKVQIDLTICDRMEDKSGMPNSVAVKFPCPFSGCGRWLLCVLCALCGARPNLALAEAPEIETSPFGHWRTFTEGGKFVTTLCPDGTGGVWCGSEDGGLRHFDGIWWREIRLPHPHESPPSIALSPAGVWLGFSRSGVALLSPGGKWTSHGIWRGLPAKRVHAVLAAKGGAVWAGTDRGLWRWDARWEKCRTAGAGEPGSVTAVVEWREVIMAGTDFQGVWKLKDERLAPLGAEGLPDRRVHDLAVGPDGRLWVATFRGAAVLEGDKWTTVPLPVEGRTAEEEKAAVCPATQAVLALSADRQGSIWMGTRSYGLFRYSPQDQSWQRIGGALPDLFVRALRTDPDGTVWAGTYGGGVTQFEPSAFVLEAGDLFLCFADSEVRCPKGWVYDDRRAASSLPAFIYGRRLRKAQCDTKGQYVCLYFSGPERVRGLEVPETGDAFAGVTHLKVDTGQVRFAASQLPLRPVRWNRQGTWVAAQTGADQLTAWQTGTETARRVRSPEAVEDFAFAEDELVVVQAHGGRAANWPLNEEVEALTFGSRESPLGTSLPVRDLRRCPSALAQGNNAQRLRREEPAAQNSQAGSLDTRDRGRLPISEGETFEASAGPLALKPDEQAQFLAPDRVSGPMVFFCFVYETARDAEDRGPVLEIRAESGGQQRAYRLDGRGPGAQRAELCIPLRPEGQASVRVVGLDRAPVTLSEVHWWAPSLEGERATAVKALLPGAAGPSTQFAASSLQFYVRGPDRIGSSRRATFAEAQVKQLSDGDLREPIWKPLEEGLGWSLEIEFREPLEIEAVIALGAPGRQSEQATGLSLESWDTEHGRWEWVTGEHGEPQFQQSLFPKCAAAKFRVGCVSTKGLLTELLVIGRPVEGVEDQPETDF